MGGYATLDTVRDVAVVGNRAYLGKYANEGVEVLDVSNPGKPVRLGGIGNVWPNFFGHGLAVADGTLYVAAYSGLWVFDLANPAPPQLVAEYDTAGCACKCWMSPTQRNLVGLAGATSGWTPDGQLVWRFWVTMPTSPQGPKTFM